MTYQIGQIVPITYRRGIVAGPDLDAPVWYALRVPPQSESKTRAMLDRRGIHAFYPSQARFRVRQGRRIEWEAPIVSGIVYALFRQQPQWDVMMRHRRMITGVICSAGAPVAIGRDIIRHLQGLTVEAERLKAARAELLRVRAGDTAAIIAGPLAGFAVEVSEVRGLQAQLLGPWGAKLWTDLASLERVVPPATSCG